MMEHAILQHGRAEENRRKNLGCLVHTEVMDLRGWKRMGSPKERVSHSMSRERDGGCQHPFSLRIGRRRKSQRTDEKRRVRENRKELEGSMMSSWR